KLLLVALAVIVAVGWFAFSAFSSRGMATHVSRGDLAAVHATWDTQCEACHVPFQPIVDQSWTTALNRDPRTSNQRCEQCHAGAHPRLSYLSPAERAVPGPRSAARVQITGRRDDVRHLTPGSLRACRVADVCGRSPLHLLPRKHPLSHARGSRLGVDAGQRL